MNRYFQEGFEKTAKFDWGWLKKLKSGAGKFNDKVIDKLTSKVSDDVLEDMIKAKKFKKKSRFSIPMSHTVDPEQLENLYKKIDDVALKIKPKIGPIHLLGASILSGIGFPIGTAIAQRSKDTATAALDIGIDALPGMRPKEMNVGQNPRFQNSFQNKLPQEKKYIPQERNSFEEPLREVVKVNVQPQYEFSRREY